MNDPASSPTPDISVSVCETDAGRAAALAIRFTVFVDEQNVPAELEADEYDADALHLLATDVLTGQTVGTARILDKGNGVAKIGRVAVLSEFRGRGVGKLLMEEALRLIRERGFAQIVLDAQMPVIPFYERLDFTAEGPIFDDAGIDHRRMIKKI